MSTENILRKINIFQKIGVKSYLIEINETMVGFAQDDQKKNDNL